MILRTRVLLKELDFECVSERKAWKYIGEIVYSPLAKVDSS